MAKNPPPPKKKSKPCPTCGAPIGEHTVNELADCRARRN